MEVNTNSLSLYLICKSFIHLQIPSLSALTPLLRVVKAPPCSPFSVPASGIFTCQHILCVLPLMFHVIDTHRIFSTLKFCLEVPKLTKYLHHPDHLDCVLPLDNLWTVFLCTPTDQGLGSVLAPWLCFFLPHFNSIITFLH